MSAQGDGPLTPREVLEALGYVHHPGHVAAHYRDARWGWHIVNILPDRYAEYAREFARRAAEDAAADPAERERAERIAALVARMAP